MKNHIRSDRSARKPSSNWVRLTTSCCLAACLAAPLAYAGPRKPAPITFAGQGGKATQTTQSRDAAPGRRVEYRYPDQPELVYDDRGARSAAADAPPIAFSSSEAAIGAMATRQYAAVTPARATTDPAITPGGFDAKAAAARVADGASSRAIDETALAPMPTPVESFTPNADPGYDETGLASIYPADFAGVPTANGEIIDLDGMTAAHPTLPLPSLVQVINLDNGKEVVVRVNDRGPFEAGRLIELSPRAADVLGVNDSNGTRVRVRYLGEGPAASPTEAPKAADLRPASVPRPTPVPKPPAPQRVAQVRQTPDRQTGADGFFIQAGSFSDIGNAERLHGRFAAQFGAKIVPARVHGSDFFRVLLGPFSGRADAQATRDQLAASGVLEGLVVASK